MEIVLVADVVVVVYVVTLFPSTHAFIDSIEHMAN